MSGGAEANKYRPCAGALVFNQQKQILVGERIKSRGQWQPCQGGIDGSETPSEAAKRELYEEMGLRVGEEVQEVGCLDEQIKYDVPPGTWLQKEGFVGQEMFWTLYYYPGQDLPPVDLSGLGGEKPEFSKVKWTTFEELLPGVVLFKANLFSRLQVLRHLGLEYCFVRSKLSVFGTAIFCFGQQLLEHQDTLSADSSLDHQ